MKILTSDELRDLVWDAFYAGYKAGRENFNGPVAHPKNEDGFTYTDRIVTEYERKGKVGE